MEFSIKNKKLIKENKIFNLMIKLKVYFFVKLLIFFTKNFI